jgi:hypothetical protein
MEARKWNKHRLSACAQLCIADIELVPEPDKAATSIAVVAERLHGNGA